MFARRAVRCSRGRRLSLRHQRRTEGVALRGPSASTPATPSATWALRLPPSRSSRRASQPTSVASSTLPVNVIRATSLRLRSAEKSASAPLSPCNCGSATGLSRSMPFGSRHHRRRLLGCTSPRQQLGRTSRSALASYGCRQRQAAPSRGCSLGGCLCDSPTRHRNRSRRR